MGILLMLGNMLPTPGFYDMHGNVAEWNTDWYAEYLIGNPVVDPIGVTPLSPFHGKIYRGGSWGHSPHELRSAKDDMMVPSAFLRLSPWFQNTNKSPSDLNFSAPLTIAENQPIGTVVGEFNATDPDDNAILTYSLVDGNGSNDNSHFTLDHLNLASFPSLLVWLDGQDFSSIRKDASGFVDLWEDKSGKTMILKIIPSMGVQLLILLVV